jgi:hypothetical protein
LDSDGHTLIVDLEDFEETNLEYVGKYDIVVTVTESQNSITVSGTDTVIVSGGASVCVGFGCDTGVNVYEVTVIVEAHEEPIFGDPTPTNDL